MGLPREPGSLASDVPVLTKSLSELIANVRSIFRNEIDKMMTPYKKSNPDFYSGYFAARITVNRAASQHKIRLLVSERQAELFLAYSDDDRARDPRSLHYSFVRAHKMVLDAKDSPGAYAAADEAVTRLNWKCSAYLEHLTADFLSKAKSLNLLKLPEARLQPEISNI